jgi:hypothetical protein
MFLAAILSALAELPSCHFAAALSIEDQDAKITGSVKARLVRKVHFSKISKITF